MENTSKALIIGAEVLIGVLLLTLMVLMFREAGNFSKTVNDNIEAKTISEFNAQFTIYQARDNLVAQDVITIANLARNYNLTQDTKLQIQVIVRGADSKYNYAHTLKDEQTYEFIQKYAIQTQRTFTCTNITVQELTGKVNKIELKINP